ncbi:MAG: helix-turn-helix transcriptional regulator, partial [bacterium]|nr:helix-turn-helix transcriptional regulator [bacterium]
MENETNMAIARRLKDIREALKMKQVDFAKRLGVSPAGLSEMEKGRYKPNIDVAMILVAEFNVNLYYLVMGEGGMFSGEK